MRLSSLYAALISVIVGAKAVSPAPPSSSGLKLQRADCMAIAAALKPSTRFGAPLRATDLSGEAAPRLFADVGNDTHAFVIELLRECNARITGQQRAQLSVLRASLTPEFQPFFELRPEAPVEEALEHVSFFSQSARTFQNIASSLDGGGGKVSDDFLLDAIAKADFIYPTKYAEKTMRDTTRDFVTIRAFLEQLHDDIFDVSRVKLRIRLTAYVKLFEKLTNYLFTNYATFSRALESVKSDEKGNKKSQRGKQRRASNEANAITLGSLERRYGNFVPRSMETMLDNVSSYAPQFFWKRITGEREFVGTKSQPYPPPDDFSRELCHLYVSGVPHSPTAKTEFENEPATILFSAVGNMEAYATVVLRNCPNLEAASRAKFSIIRILQLDDGKYGKVADPQSGEVARNLEMIHYFGFIVGALLKAWYAAGVLAKTDASVPDDFLHKQFENPAQLTKFRSDAQVEKARTLASGFLREIECDIFTKDSRQLAELLGAYYTALLWLEDEYVRNLGRWTASELRNFAVARTREAKAAIEMLQHNYKILASVINVNGALTLLELMNEKGVRPLLSDALLSVGMIAGLNERRKTLQGDIAERGVVASMYTALTGFRDTYRRVIGGAYALASSRRQRSALPNTKSRTPAEQQPK